MAAAVACMVLFLARATLAGGSDPPPTTEPIVPALIVFGDSSVDIGNNNYIANTAFKANYPPYGEDFSHGPTGRFSDGRLVVDFTAESLGFNSTPAAYLSPEAAGRRLRTGVNFASAGCGYWEETSQRYNAISLKQQLENFREYRLKLVRVVGKKEMVDILSKALYILSVGNGDLVQNYYINPSLRQAYTFDAFTDILVSNLIGFVQELYRSGARRIGVTSMPAMGCFPATVNNYGGSRPGCVAWLNHDAEAINNKQKVAVASLAKQHPNLKIGVLDIYQPVVELATNFSKHGFVEARKGCCVTGTSGTTILCKPNSLDICKNSSQYVFWDGVHPTEAANKYIADSLFFVGITLIY